MNRKGDTGMAPVVTMRQLLESGVHFGHQTRRWNPKMKRFIFTERNGIYIIDLQQSLDFIDRAYEFIKETVAHGGTVLYVGTKKQAQEAIAEQARRVGMPFVNQRWLGGMLTNFSTVYKRLQRLKELDEIDFEDVAGSGMTKKELLHLRRERDKLDRSLGGIKDMARTPSALWIVDTKKEHIAVSEARKLGIPVIAILDTNCDPDEVTYPIPGNDDAIRSVSLLTRVVADAVADGLMARAGAANGEDKPAAPGESRELGAEEPLAEWERELLEHEPSSPETAPDATAEAAPEATAEAAPEAAVEAAPEATAEAAPEAAVEAAPEATAEAAPEAAVEAAPEATAEAAPEAAVEAAPEATAEAAPEAAVEAAPEATAEAAPEAAAEAAAADATAGDAAAAGPEAPAGEAAAEQAGDAAPDAAKAGAPDVA
jgi:small subunit ribosomal protein S2